MFLKDILAKAKAANTMEEIDDTLEAIYKKLDESLTEDEVRKLDDVTTRLYRKWQVLKAEEAKKRQEIAEQLKQQKQELTSLKDELAELKALKNVVLNQEAIIENQQLEIKALQVLLERKRGDAE